MNFVYHTPSRLAVIAVTNEGDWYVFDRGCFNRLGFYCNFKFPFEKVESAGQRLVKQLSKGHVLRCAVRPAPQLGANVHVVVWFPNPEDFYVDEWRGKIVHGQASILSADEQAIFQSLIATVEPP